MRFKLRLGLGLFRENTRSGYQDCSSVLLDSCFAIAPCSICPKSDCTILNLLSFMVGLSLQSLRVTNRRPWPKRCSEVGLHCCLLLRLVSREEQ